MSTLVHHELERILSRPGTTLSCLDVDGAPVPIPDALARWTDAVRTDVDRGLDLFDVVSHGEAVAAFVGATLGEHMTTVVRLSDGSVQQLDAFDHRDDLGCIVLSLSPTESPLPVHAVAGAELPIRRCTTRMDSAGRTIWADAGYEQMTGYSADEVSGGFSAFAIHDDDMERARISFAELLQRPGGQTRIRLRVRHRDGSWRWFEITRTNLLHTDDPHIFSESYDLTAEMAAQSALQQRTALLSELTEAMPLGVVHFTPDGDIDLQNERWTQMTGVAPKGGLADVVAATFDDANEVLELVVSDTESGDVRVPVRFSSPLLGSRSGLLRRIAVTEEVPQPNPDRSHDPGVTPSAWDHGVLLTLEDTTESVNHQRELRRIARTDHLTQLLNRYGLEEEIRQILSDGSCTDRLSVAYFDIDDFKSVNDTLGHAVGDLRLRDAAAAITSAVGDRGMCGRLGGDEFLVVFCGIDADAVQAMARNANDRMLAATGLTVSFGMTTAEPTDDFHALMHRADRKMYFAKGRRRS